MGSSSAPARRTALVALLSLGAFSGLMLTAGGASAQTGICSSGAGGTESCAFGTLGVEQEFVVPDGVTAVLIEADGGHGGQAMAGVATADGGKGGRITGTVAVVPGTTLYVEVGGNAFSDDSCLSAGTFCKGGFNGGGSTAATIGGNGGGGGGASDVRTVTRSDPASIDSRLIVAGGGGGAGSPIGCGAGTGGDAAADGADGPPCPQDGGQGGTAGTSSSGGTGGAGGDYIGGAPGSGNGADGTAGAGGNGGSPGGGAGGGGRFGGGGGGSFTKAAGSDTYNGGGGGGGGGSNLTPTDATIDTNDAADAKVIITYQKPVVATAPTISGTPPAGGIGEHYGYSFHTTGTPAPTVSRTAGSLPPGLSLSSTGKLSGTPSRAGTYHFTVKAENASGSKSRSVTLTIRPVPRIRSAGANMLEGNSGTRPLKMVVSLSRSSSLPISVHWVTADSSAKAPHDYTAAAGTLTFAPGQTSRTLSVLVQGDQVHEPNEVFFVLFSNPSHATIATPRVTGGIRNDD